MLVLSFFGIIMTVSFFGDIMFFKDRYKRAYFESVHGFVVSLIITIAIFLARYAIPHGQELIDFLTALYAVNFFDKNKNSCYNISIK